MEANGDTALNAVIAGPNFSKAQLLFATTTDTFLLAPPTRAFPSNVLPAPLVGGPKGPAGYFPGSNPCGTTPPISALKCAEISETGLPSAQYHQFLAGGGTGLESKTPDTRITNVQNPPAGPFQITNGSTFPYDAYAASPVHRFYQMWQQLNCNLENATPSNPSSCNGALFSYVEATVGAGTNGATQPPLCSSNGNTLPCFTYNYLNSVPGAQTTGEGSTALAFYNVQQGDAPYFKSLADQYTMSDNFHQSVNGGTDANHMLGHADAIFSVMARASRCSSFHNTRRVVTSRTATRTMSLSTNSSRETGRSAPSVTAAVTISRIQSRRQVTRTFRSTDRQLRTSLTRLVSLTDRL